MNVTDFPQLVSSAALVRADGSLAQMTLEQDGQWQYDNVVLLDFEDGSAGCAGGGDECADRRVFLRDLLSWAGRVRIGWTS